MPGAVLKKSLKRERSAFLCLVFVSERSYVLYWGGGKGKGKYGIKRNVFYFLFC